MTQIAHYRDAFIAYLDEKIVLNKPKNLYEPILYILQLGGKRLRPVLTLMTAEIFGTPYKKALDAALAVEVFHNFSLVHDDIMDAAPLRRGKATVHEKWDVNTGILSGDAMLIIAYQLFENYDGTTFRELAKLFSKTAIEVCEGQQLDMDFEVRDDVSIDEYIHMISLKTAVLLAACLKIGAVIGGASTEDAQRLYDFGLNAGIAFQLQDDILDVYGESKKVGKQKGGDIIANKKTYLLLKAQELATATTETDLNNWLQESGNDSEKVSAITEIYHQLNVRKLAEEKMWMYYRKGIDSLESTNASPIWKKVLLDFSEQLMHRES